MEINYFNPSEQLFDESLIKIHLRIIKRNNRKCITQVEGLPIENELDLNKLVKVWKKSFSCNAFVENDSEKETKIVILQGDHREKIKEYLLYKKIVSDPTDVIVHGF